MNENTLHEVKQPNMPNLTDDQLVDIELAKQKVHDAISRINGYPNIDNAGYIARATTNTIKDLLVAAGVASEVGFYNLYTEKLLAKEEQIADMLDIDLAQDLEDAEETEETVG